VSSPISGFTSVPNPQMLAFMPIQSYLMMYFAGSGWQYGKRKISAMSNEQFNKLTSEELLKQHSIELKDMLPTLEKSLNDVTPLVEILIKQYGDFMKVILEQVGPLLQTLAVQVTGTGEGRPLFAKEGDDLLDYLKKQFNFLPEAEARRGGSTGSSLQELDRQKQKERDRSNLNERAREQQLIYAKTQAQIRKANRVSTRNIPSVDQIALKAQRKAPQTKLRKAGQTQIKARNQLIKDIATLAQVVKTITASPYASAQGRQSVKNKLGAKQKELTGLLLRYRF